MFTYVDGLLKYKDASGQWHEADVIKGESAYQAAVRLGIFSGTESEYYNKITNDRDSALSQINTKLTEVLSAIDTKKQQTLADIPDDYTTLSGDVSDLKSATLWLKREYATRLSASSTTDLNDVTTPGTYYIGATSDATSINNTPVNNPGGIVVRTIMTDVIVQTYSANIPNAGNVSVYTRLRTGAGIWGEWSKITNETDITSKISEALVTAQAQTTASIKEKAFVLDRTNAIRLTTGDCNDLTAPNNYYIGDTTSANAISNLPIIKPGRLIVITLLNAVPAQFYIPNDTTLYFRKCSANVWTPWAVIGPALLNNVLISYDNPENYPLTQGFCITDRFIYIASIADDSNEIIQKYDKFTLTKISEIEFTGLIGHANDFTWNPYTKRIYCAKGAGTKDIVVFDEDFTYIETLTLDYLSQITSLSCIAFDPVLKLWAITGGTNSASNYIIWITEDLSATTALTTISYTQNQAYQGLAFANGVIYGINSSGSIKLFSVNGGTIGSIYVGVTKGVYSTHEHQNIVVLGDYIYFNAYDNVNIKTILYSTPLNALITNPLITT